MFDPRGWIDNTLHLVLDSSMYFLSLLSKNMFQILLLCLFERGYDGRSDGENSITMCQVTRPQSRRLDFATETSEGRWPVLVRPFVQEIMDAPIRFVKKYCDGRTGQNKQSTRQSAECPTATIRNASAHVQSRTRAFLSSIQPGHTKSGKL